MLGREREPGTYLLRKRQLLNVNDIHVYATYSANSYFVYVLHFRS